VRRVVIVGAGLIGLATGEALLRKGAAVELLERHPALGEEASGAAAGMLNPYGDAAGPGPLLEWVRAGLSYFPEAVYRLESRTGLDVRFRAGGMIEPAFSAEEEKALEGIHRWQSAAGIRVEFLSPETVREREPAVRSGLRRALWWPQAAQVDNRRLLEAYSAAFEGQGGRLRLGTAVEHFLTRGNRVTGVRTAAGEVSADQVINCCGAQAGFDRGLPFLIPTEPVKGELLSFRTERPLFRAILQCGDGYAVQRSEHELIAGTTSQRVGFDKQPTEAGRRKIFSVLERLTDRLAGHAPEGHWAGLRPASPDGLPLLGPTPLEGLWIAAGHFRNGVMMAPATGRWMAEAVWAGRPLNGLDAFLPDRFMVS